MVLKESPGKGMGVFATKAFKKDAFVAVYPSHMVGMELDSERVAWQTDCKYTLDYINKLAKNYGQKSPAESSQAIHSDSTKGWDIW